MSTRRHGHVALIWMTLLALASATLAAPANRRSGRTSSGPAPAWSVPYDGPVHGTDTASAIAMDSGGNVYVTGPSWGGSVSAGGTDFDYATVKYNKLGQPVWSARYNGPGGGKDVSRAIAVDATGNVYVTGYSPGLGTGIDYATVKYDPNGRQQWVARYDSTNGDDVARTLSLDPSGNIFVTGSSPQDSGDSNDIVTVKYRPDGSVLWMARYNGPAGGNDVARAMAVDNVGGVSVTGSSWGGETFDGGTGYDFATIKYDASGRVQFLTVGEGTMLSPLSSR